MKFLDPLVRRSSGVESRFSFNEYLMMLSGNQYLGGNISGSRPDVPDSTFVSYVDQVHRRNGVVSAAVEARALLLSQLRFRWYNMNTNELTTNRELRRLERPGQDTRPGFLHRLEVDASYAGSAYVAKVGGEVRRLRPDHCSVLLGSNLDPRWDGTDTLTVPADAEVLGLVYQPNHGASVSASDVTVFMPGEFAIWSPEPDPINFWRGVSWVSAVMREVLADGQATDHQSKFFEKAATPNLVFLMDPTKSPEETRQFADIVNKNHAGAANAYKNLFLGGGTDVKVVGSTLESLNLKDMTGGFETRVALRSRVPGVILGVREGYAGSSLNAGNYNSARRMLADGWLAPTADSLCCALEALLNVPANSELSHDPSKILFLQEDGQQAADILSTKSAAMRTLVDGGFDPQVVVDAVSNGDLSKLQHTGKLSVQLQPPGEGEDPDPAPDPVSDGEGDRSGSLERSSQPVWPIHIRNELPLQPAPEVTVTNEIVERAAEPPVVNVEAPTVNVEAPTVNVEPAAVSVAAPDVVVERGEQPVVNVNVEPTPVLIENLVETPRSKHKVRRDSDGRIVEIREEPE